jgi:hypothetical protein
LTAASSTEPSLRNGVMSAVPAPVNGVRITLNLCRSRCYVLPARFVFTFTFEPEPELEPEHEPSRENREV